MLATTSVASAGELTVVSVEPAARTLTASVHSSIVVRFDLPVRRESVTSDSFSAFGRWSGAVRGAYSFSDGDRTVTLRPGRRFSAGEQVMVILSHDLIATSGETLRLAGYSYQFWTRTRAAGLVFEQIASMSTRSSPTVRSRAYGGVASDLNGDGWLDVSIVNEDTADLRVFLNRADGSGLFHDFLRPTTLLAFRASPSEPADFNRDGIVDLCVANIGANTVSILTGVGDGTFATPQEINVAGDPRGIVVLDVDGDGDVDVVNTNAVGNNMSLLLNDGSGVFGPPTFFEGGGSGEWALAAADMNADGLLDLVIGARSSRQILVNLGNGDATFSHVSSQNSGGATWMLVCGDVNGDGAEDVACVNSTNNNGAILVGDGTGALAAPQTHATDSFPIATDLGDLDGDGDLDWITSSFSGDWMLFENTAASFAFQQRFPAPQAASCCLMLDFDNDEDLDLALIDEIADVVVLMRNVTPPCPADLDGDGDVDLSDLGMLLADFGCATGNCPGDADDDGDTDLADLGILLAAFGQPCK